MPNHEMPGNDGSVKNPEIENEQSGKSKPLKNQAEIKKEKEYELAKVNIGVLFKSYNTGAERVQAMEKNIKKFVNLFEIEDTISEKLEACKGVQGKKEFVERVFEAIKPMIDLTIEKSELFEAKEPEQIDVQERIRINEILSCDVERNIVNIHVDPDEQTSDAMIKFKDGLEKLARLVNQNENIERINAKSWIVARHPKIVEKFGFILDGEAEVEVAGVVRKAHMTRNDFLNKYIK